MNKHDLILMFDLVKKLDLEGGKECTQDAAISIPIMHTSMPSRSVLDFVF